MTTEKKVSKKTGRMGFDVAYCSGEDENNPAAELHHHTRTTKGWQSPKFSEYPQELLLRFKGDTYVEQIQFLSHASKIASKIEVFISPPTAESSASRQFYPLESCAWRRLGYLSQTDQSEYMARELKTVHVNVTALYLRLLFHKCHINSYNYFNQVGLVALNVVGSMGAPYHYVPTPYALRCGVAPMDERAAFVPLKDMKPVDMTGYSSQDARYQIQLDPITQRRIRDLTLVKQHAVQEEDYDTAKRMKEQIDNLRHVGAELLRLETQKKEAVQKEDFDLAKALKLQIDQLRSRASCMHSSTAPGTSAGATPVCLPPMQAAAHAPAKPPSAGYSVNQHPPLPPLTNTPQAPPPLHHRAAAPEAPAHQRQPIAPSPPIPVTQHARLPSPIAKPAPEKVQRANSLDERPAISSAYKKVKPIEPEEAEAEGSNASTKAWYNIDSAVRTDDPFNTHDQQPALGRSKNEAPPGETAVEAPLEAWERDLFDRIVANHQDASTADELPDATKRLCGEMSQHFGDFATRCLFSKKWQLREAAVKAIAGKISAGEGDGSPLPSDASTCAALLLRHLAHKSHGLNDAINAVVVAAFDALRALFHAKALHNATVSAAVPPVAGLLVVKAGDPLQRVRELSTELLMYLGSSPLYSVERVASLILHEQAEPADKKKKQSAHAWRPVLARATLVQLILDKFGLNRRDLKNVFTVDAIMTKVVLPAINHPNGEVREAGIKVVARLHQLGAEKSAAKHLHELKPALKAAIEKECESEASASRRHGAPQEKEMMNTSISIEGDDRMKQQMRAARKAAAAERSPPLPPQPAPEDDGDMTTCQFCKRHDDRYNPQVLDQHYLFTCPMLNQCHLCEQVIEVMLLNEHWLTECAQRSSMKQCPTCKDAVAAAEYDQHVKAAQCEPPSDKHGRCSLCKKRIGPGEEGWEKHLLSGCPKNPRKVNESNPVELRNL